MIGSLRKVVSPDRKDTRQARSLDEGRRKQRSPFEAAATHVAASVDDDRALADEASGRGSPEALSFGVSEPACRAVIAPARERDESPRAVARSLPGLPAD
ncbi:hypothetical protein [Streptomyces sp. NPDC093149]|uniref:hypothetical protein n=1 Tax=Streptomyces sp. NPDC093149 TaxID=3366031 RepID=UPI0038205195